MLNYRHIYIVQNYRNLYIAKNYRNIYIALNYKNIYIALKCIYIVQNYKNIYIASNCRNMYIVPYYRNIYIMPNYRNIHKALNYKNIYIALNYICIVHNCRTLLKHWIIETFVLHQHLSGRKIFFSNKLFELQSSNIMCNACTLTLLLASCVLHCFTTIITGILCSTLLHYNYYWHLVFYIASLQFIDIKSTNRMCVTCMNTKFNP